MKTIRSLLSPVLCVLVLQFPVVAHAGSKGKAAVKKFHETCDGVLANSSPETAGDQAVGECKKGKMAAKVYKNQDAAAVIYGVATGVAIVMAVLEQYPVTTAAAKGVCFGLSAAAVGKQFLDSSTLKKASSEITGEYAKGVNTAVKAGAMALGGVALKGLLFNGKTVSQVMNTVSTTSNSGTETGCIMTAVGLGVMTTASASAATNARKVLEAVTTTANTQVQAAANTQSFGLGYNHQQNPGPNYRPSAPDNRPTSEDSCDRFSGTAYAKCIGNEAPEVAALVNDPKIFDTLNKALGQNLGDFAKNYNGDSDRDLSNYIGQGLGMSGDSMAAAFGSTKKLAKDLGVKEAYKPGSFVAANNGKTGGSGGVDPMEKMLADMMAKMGDMGEDGLGKEREPAGEISFNNQMELLGADQISNRKDISLFDRVGYRMQKNIKNLEQLNWSTRDSN